MQLQGIGHSNYYSVDDFYFKAQQFTNEPAVLNCIKKIFEKKEFQTDREAYVEDWIAKRGTVERVFAPEDHALIFFKRYIGYGFSKR